MYPSKWNILSVFRELIDDSRSGDSLFFSFSGHGTQCRDTNGDEPDGWDEALVPADFMSAGLILDDHLRELLQKLSPGARLTALIDACHSGSAMDLPFEVALCANVYPPSINPPPYLEERAGEVVFIASCHDSEEASDSSSALGDGPPCGAMTVAFIEVVEFHIIPQTRHGAVSFRLLMAIMRMLMRQRGLAQNPVLSSTRRDPEGMLFSL